MANFYPSSQEEAAAYPGLRSLVDETLRDLWSRVEFIHECWHGKTDEEKAQFGWCVALGVLAYDIATSVAVLLDADRLRAAKLLGRSLFEYHLRLRIYQRAPSEALRDAAEAPKELRRFFESKPLSEVEKLDISVEDLAEFERFIADNKGKPRSRNVWDDLKIVNVGDDAQALFEYLNLYGYPSALAHGSGLIFEDVIQSKHSSETVLAWKSPYLTRFLIVGEMFVRLVGILEAIEKTSEYFQAHVVLNRKYHAIMRPIAQRFAQTARK